MTLATTAALLILAGAGPAPAAEQAPRPSAASPLPAAALASIEDRINAAMLAHSIPGLSVAIVTERTLRWSNGYGMADLENFVAARPFTVYRLASVSKPITAVAVMQLAERGAIDLEAPARRYVPDFPEKPWPFSVRQLLCHQAGIRNWTEDEFLSTRHYATLSDTLAQFRDDPLVNEPGVRATYSSFGYTLLGRAVETASGLPFVEYLRINLFEPAGMEMSRADDVTSIIPNRARGYRLTSGGLLLNSPLTDTSNRLPGGGLVGTAEDVARFAAALMSGTLVRRDTLQRMLTGQSLKSGQVTGYGLGFMVGNRSGVREVYHSGGQSRVSTLLYMRPGRGLAVVLLTNLEGVGAPLLELARGIADVVSR